MCLIVGTYTEHTGYTTGHAPGAYLVQLNPADGSMSLLSTITEGIGTNPTFAAYNPTTSTAYFTNEVVEGMVKAFSLVRGSGGAASSLTLLNEQESGGEGPCFLEVGPAGNIFCANYFSGELTVFGTDPVDGALRSPRSTMLPSGSGDVTFPGPVKVRQDGPHAHCFVPDVDAPSSGLAFACDLGSDEVVLVRVVSTGPATGAISVRDRCKLPPGSGPRHLAQGGEGGRRIVVCGELSSTLTLLDFDREAETLRLVH